MSIKSLVRRNELELISLTKGDVITAVYLEDWLAADCETKTYKLRAFEFIAALDPLFAEYGFEYVFQFDPDGNIRICSDAAAVEYCRKQQERAVKLLYKHARKLSGINRKNLVPAERRQYDKQNQVSALMRAGLKSSRRKKSPQGHHLPKEIKPRFRTRKLRCRRLLVD